MEMHSETILWNDLTLSHSLEHHRLSALPMMHANIGGEIVTFVYHQDAWRIFLAVQ